ARRRLPLFHAHGHGLSRAGRLYPGEGRAARRERGLGLAERMSARLRRWRREHRIRGGRRDIMELRYNHKERKEKANRFAYEKRFFEERGLLLVHVDSFYGTSFIVWAAGSYFGCGP